MGLKVVKPRVRKVSSEAQTLKETQRTHGGVVLNECCLLENVGRIR